MASPNVVSSVARSALAVFFEYDTPRIVHIRSKKVGLFNRSIQLVILVYIIGYAIIYKKGYQDFENVQSAVTSKVKGIVFSDTTIPGIGQRTWDVADYVIPPQENNAFFVMTNVVATPGQTQGKCPEDPSVNGAKCQNNTDCEQNKGDILPGGNGPVTGQCVPSDVTGENSSVCEIFGWCQVEKDTKSKVPVLQGARNFTVFLKNNIEFPKFGVKRRNLIGFANNSELSACRWKRGDSKQQYCPIFLLDDIANDAGVTFQDMTTEGGVMQIIIDWTCNLDYSEEDCVPEYTFRRLDTGNFSVARGFNFRYADRYSVFNETTNNLELYRNLYKAYGVRFLITVQGKAGKFSIVPLVLNIGSGLALLSVATILCDIMVLYVLKARHFYKNKKYLDVQGADAYEVLDEGHQKMEDSTESVKRRSNNKSHESDGGAYNNVA